MIDQFFQYDQTQVKFSPVYMDEKGNYKQKEKAVTYAFPKQKETELGVEGYQSEDSQA